MNSVLFVSHDADLRAVAGRVLRAAGFDARTAAHGGHALLACVERGTFDVLVIENDLPEGSGEKIGRRLQRHCPGLEMVLMRDAGRRTGDAAAVVRPFTADDLIDAIDWVHTARRATSR